MTNKFNLHNYEIEKLAGRKKIRDRGINWKESYGEKSEHLKARYDKILGEGSYRRWEGHDYTTDADYFVIVGPSLERSGIKSFFAGIKRLPPKERRHKIYSPSGKYFPTITAALSYATKMWGVRYPQDQIPYTRDSLQGIEVPRHLKA